MAWPYDDEIPPPPEGYTLDEPVNAVTGAPTDYTAFTSGLASTFGYNDPQDTGVGAWGDITNDPNAYGVSLSEEELRRHFGDPDKAHGQLVEVTANGQTVLAPIVDKGPANWVIDRQGPTIDVTEGVRRDLGGTGLDKAQWRIVPPPPEGYTLDQPQAQPQGGAVGGGAIPPPPPGFQLDVTERYGANLNPDLTNKLGLTELNSGIPLNVISGYRDEEHNAEVGGAKGSQHIHGNAVDIDVSGMPVEQRLQLIANASANGITGIGVYDNSLHFDVGERRAWGPSHHSDSIPDWAQPVIGQHMRGEITPPPSGESETQEIPPPPEGYTIDQPQPQAQPQAQPPPQWQDALTAGVSQALPADQPQLARNVSGVFSNWLQQFIPAREEWLKVHPGDTNKANTVAFDAAQKATPWSELRDTAKALGLKSEQELKNIFKTLPSNIADADTTTAGKWIVDALREKGAISRAMQVPHLTLGEELQVKGMEAGEVARGERPELPVLSETVSRQMSQMGLKQWRDLTSGMEVRRAGLPEEKAAVPVHGGTPSPTSLVPKKYEGMDEDTLRSVMWLSQNPATKHFMDRMEMNDTEFTSLIRDNPGIQAALTLIRNFESGGKQVSKGAEQMLAAAGHDYVNQYRDKTPEEAARAIPQLEAALAAENLKLQQLVTSPEAAKEVTEPARITGTSYPAPPMPEGPATKEDQRIAGGYAKPAELGSPQANLIRDIANISRQLQYARDRVAGKTSEHPIGKISRAAEEEGARIEKQDVERRQKYEAFINKDMAKEKSWRGFAVDFAGSTGTTFPSLMAMLGSPPIGFAAFATQQYGDSLDEIRKAYKDKGKDPDSPENYDKVRAYARDQTVEQIPFESVGEFGASMALKTLFKGISPAMLSRGNPKEIAGYLAHVIGGGALSEMITQPPQTFIQETRAEKAGVQPKTTPEEKLKKAIYETALAGTQGAVLGGGAAVAGVRQGLKIDELRQNLIAAALQRRAQQGQAPGPIAGAPATAPAAAAPLAGAPAAAAPAAAAPTATAPAAAAPTTPAVKPTVLTSLSQLPSGLGTPVGGTTAPTPTAPTPAAVTPAATTPEAEVEAETRAEAERLMKEYGSREGAFAGTVMAPDPNGKPPGIVRRLLSKVLGPSQQEQAQAAYGKEYYRTQGLGNQEAIVELGEHADTLLNSDIAKKLGIKTEVTNDPADTDRVAYVKYSPDGTVTFHVNPRVALAIHNSSGANGTALQRLMGEETAHMGETLMLREAWQQAKAAGQKPGSFVDFVNNQAVKLFSDMQVAVGTSPDNKVLQQTVRDAYNLYYSKDPTQKGGGPMRVEGPKVFTEIFKQGPAQMTEFLGEFVRMAKQQRDQGNLTESNWQKIYNIVKNWFTKSLARLNKGLPGAYEGKFGPEVQQHLQNLDAFLKGKDVALAPIAEPGAQQQAAAAITPPKPISDTTADAIVTGHSANEGSSFNEVHGDLGGTKAFQVALFPELTDYIPGKHITKEQIRKFEAKAHALGIDTSNPNLTIGTWYNPKTGQSEIDITITTSNQQQAAALAKQFNQQAIFNLETFETIQIGGTGKAKAGLPSIEERLASITATGYVTPSARPTTEGQQQAGKQLRPEKEAVLRAVEGRMEEVRGLQDKGPRGLRAQPEEGVNVPPKDVKHPDKVTTLSPGILKHYRAAYKHGLKTGEWATAKRIGALMKPYTPGLGPYEQPKGTADITPQLEAAYKEAYDKGDWQEAERIQKEADKSTELLLTPEKIDKMAREGEAYRKWYSDFSDYLDEFLGPYKEYAPLIKEFLAATSPQTAIDVNVSRTVNEFLHYVKTGEIKTKFKTHGDNLRAAVEGRKLEGPKVGEYSPALHGDLFATTMDRHMMKIFFGNQAATPAKMKIGTDQTYRAAARLGWGPAEVQAAMWGAHLARQKKDVSGAKTYGAFLENYRQQLEEVFRREAVHGGRGIEAARRAAAGISERAGPERARREEAYQRAAEAQKRGEPTPAPPRQTAKPKPESAEAEAGRRQAGVVVPPIPTTTTTPAGRVEYPRIGNIFQRRYKGMANVLLESNSPRVQNVGKAMLKHIDREAALKGELATPLVPRGALPLTNRSRAARQFQKYRETFREHGRAAADALPMSQEALRLVDAERTALTEADSERARLGIKIRDPMTGRMVPMAPIFEHPDILSPDTVNAITNRHKHHAQWERLKDAMVRERIISGATPADIEDAAHNYTAEVMEHYMANSGLVSKRMPAMAYDDTLAGVVGFVNRFAELAASRDAFGTKFALPGKTAGVDVFELAKHDVVTKRESAYLELAESIAMGRQSRDNLLTAFTNVSSLAQLANFKSTLKNLYSGIVLNPVHLGLGRSVVNLFRVKATFDAIKDGKKKGLLLQSIMNSMHLSSNVGFWGKAAGLGLRAHLYGAVETVVRAQSIMGAQQYLSSAIDSISANPNSRASRQYLGKLKRLGFGDPGGLIAEDGTGPLTDTYLRRMVANIQGGYSYADTPAFLSTSEGRFILQYGKWGTEQAQTFEREIARPFIRLVPEPIRTGAGAIMRAVPGVRALRPGLTETVTYTDKAGNIHNVKVPGEAMPMLRALIILGAAGAGWEWLIEQLFGTKSPYPTWSEIFTKVSRGDRQALADAAGKIFNYYTAMGSAGIIGDLAKRAYDASNGRTTWVEAAAGIPAVSLLTDLLGEVQDFVDRGDYDNSEGRKRFAWRIAEKFSAVKTAEQLIGRQEERLNDIFGTDYRLSRRTAKLQDLSWTKATNRRIDAELGVAPKPRFLGGVGGTEESTLKERIGEHLMLGEAYEAKRLVKEEAAKYKDSKSRDEFMKKIEASVRAKQPVYGEGGPMGELRMKWAKKNLHPDELDRYKRIQEDYVKTAKRAGLLDPKRVEPGEVSDKLAILKRAREMREREALLHPAWELAQPVTDPLAEGTMAALRGLDTGTTWADAKFREGVHAVIGP